MLRKKKEKKRKKREEKLKVAVVFWQDAVDVGVVELDL